MEATDKLGVSLSLEEGAAQAIRMVLDVKLASRKVLLAGNGGSSAIVSHVQNDLCKSVREGYGSVFEWPIGLWAEPGGLLITVSSSGQSENIVRALAAAKQHDCQMITFSGFNPDNSSRLAGDLNFYVPSHVYGFVETAHTALAHYLTNMAGAC